MQSTAEAVPTDDELVALSRSGKREAFDLLVRRYRKEIYRVARRITGDHGEADDLAQETFCRAWQSLATFRGDASCRTWLYRIATNLSLNVVQSARVSRREERTPEMLAEAGVGASPAAGVERLMTMERNQRLTRAIEGLPPRQKATLILRAFEAMPYSEIARVMECSPGTAKANFFHAVSALKKNMRGSS